MDLNELVGVFSGGVWAWMNNSSWKRLTSGIPVEDTLATGDLDGGGRDDLIAVFRGGVWARMNDSSWKRLTSGIPSGNMMATGDLDRN